MRNAPQQFPHCIRGRERRPVFFLWSGLQYVYEVSRQIFFGVLHLTGVLAYLPNNLRHAAGHIGAALVLNRSDDGNKIDKLNT